ncbi:MULTISPECIES: barstar family protein [unclassified Psychrobacter]|uniref:barstar family protein n=1 Tax=unclassified Psychrobacter TaxID=196806 RepID=UPI003FB95129
MSQAIHYLNQNCKQHNEQDSNQNGTALNASVPTQAVNIVIDDILNKTTLLTSLGYACDFPSYYSHNWDSAWDCLTDSDVTDLTLDLTAIKKIDTEDFNTFKSIIEDAYRDFGQPTLWVIMPSTNNT